MDLTFDLGSILSPEEIENLFVVDTKTPDKPAEGNSEETPNDATENNQQLELKDPIVDNSESVGSEENDELDNNFYSSIASALKQDGVLSDIDNTESIKNAEDFTAAIEKHIEQRFNDRQKRIEEALNNGIEPDLISQFENARQNLNSISESMLEAEDENGDNLRRQILVKDYMNKGYSAEKAQREADKAFSCGTDVEDAKEALLGLKLNLESQYTNLLNDRKLKQLAQTDAINKRNAELQNMILKDDKAFGTLEVSQNERQKAFEALAKPVYRDPDTGDYLTAILKYQKEHPNDFYKNMSILFVKTEGFTKLGNLISSQVKQETKKAMRELENTLNHTSRTNNGSLRFASGIEDLESVFKGFDLDI